MTSSPRISPLKDVMGKARALLRACARRGGLLGGCSSLDPERDYTLGYCASQEELKFLIDAIVDLNWVKKYGGRESEVSLTIEGWSEVERLAPNESDKAFVAMWFNDKMKPIFENGIKPAIKSLGYNTIRVDGIEHIGKIDDRIIAEIKESRFVAADFTGHRGVVYFEAGFALGLGLPVIWTCREDSIAELHFDIRQYSCIVWIGADKLRERLSDRIRATIGGRS